MIPASQSAIVVVLVGFWFLFQTGQEWVSVAFYVLGLIFAILLVSQFWSLANARKVTLADGRKVFAG